MNGLETHLLPEVVSPFEGLGARGYECKATPFCAARVSGRFSAFSDPFFRSSEVPAVPAGASAVFDFARLPLPSLGATADDAVGWEKAGTR